MENLTFIEMLSALGLMSVFVSGLTEIWKTKVVPKFSSETMAAFWVLVGAMVFSVLISVVIYLGSTYVDSWEEIVTAAGAIWLGAIGVFNVITKAVKPILDAYKK